MPAAAPRLRQATSGDIETLIELNRLCFPTMVEKNVVWTREQLMNHLRVFPQGQIVVELGGQLLGAVSSLIVDMGDDPYRSHSYDEITSNGSFSGHNVDGDTLYGADVYVHPEHRGLRLGHALYEARRELCRWFNLRRIIAGGRLHGYAAHAEKLTAEAYVGAVVRGELKDMVLSFQLREGFRVRKIMKSYIRDPLSRDHATLIEWVNPDHRPRGNAISGVHRSPLARTPSNGSVAGQF